MENKWAALSDEELRTLATVVSAAAKAPEAIKMKGELEKEVAKRGKPQGILTKVSCSNQEHDYDCEYMLVSLTPVVAKFFIKRIRLVTAMQMTDAELVEMRYACNAPVMTQYFGFSKEPDDERTDAQVGVVEAALTDDGVVQFKAVLAPEALKISKSQRIEVEIERLIVTNEAVIFTCFPDGSEDRLTSAEIPIQLLREIAAQVPSAPVVAST